MKNLSEKFVHALFAEIGEENVLLDEALYENYARDETPELFFLPDIVILPQNSAACAKALQICFEHNVPVTPRGAGSGVCGGALPICGGAVISTEKLNKIIDIDEKNLVAVVQPGVVTGVLQRECAKQKLYYPPDPASVDSCSIGGNVATGAGGMRAFKYGTTKKFVQGLTAAIPPGMLVHCGGKMIKDVAGYDLMGILTGSEGTLGIFTELIMKLMPKPAYQVDLLVGFATMRAAAEAALSIVPETGIMPAAMEFWESEITSIVSKFLERPLPFENCEAQLIIAIDGADEQAVERDYFRVGEHLLGKGAVDVLVACNAKSCDKLWKTRRSIREAVRGRSPDIAAEDVAVPPTKTPDLLEGVKKIGERYNATIVGFGHIGDGNLHIDLLRDNMTLEQWQTAKEIIVAEILELSVALGGTITGEHGVGYIKRHFLHLGGKQNEITAMRAIKHAIDPKGLMNPQKIFL